MAYPELSHRYDLVRPLGAGGMGEVFLVRDRMNGRQCALKHLKTRPGLQRPEMEREFRALARLRHPTVVSVYECGISPAGRPFFTMEYVPGLPVDSAVKAGDWRGLIQAASEIAHGLEVLHSANIVHGDLKPSNVLAVVDGDGALLDLRLVDFGLSASLGEREMTHRGSPGYAAPEIVRGGRMEVTSDLYSFGATLFTLACGRLPFQAASVEELLRQQVGTPPDGSLLEDSGTPARLLELILRLMAPEPERRPGTAREVRRELESLLPGARPDLLQRLRAEVVVGRARELELIEAKLRKPQAGARAIVFVGPDGMGKSALLSEAARRAALAGHPVVSLTPRRLEHLIGDAPTGQAAEVLIRHFRSLGSEASVPLILLDDVDQLGPRDESAVRHFLLDPDSPRAVWAMAQTGETDGMAEGTLTDSGVVTLCQLRPIGRPAIAEMVGARLREAPHAELEDFLWVRGRGHPATTLQALQILVSQGALRDADAGLVVDREVLAQLPREPANPLTMALGRVSGSALDLLGIVALAGDVGTEALREVGPDALRDLAELRHLALVDDADAGRVRLAHAELAEQVLSRIPGDRARALLSRALELRSMAAQSRFRLLIRAGKVEEAIELMPQVWDQTPDAVFAASVAELLESTHPLEAASWYERLVRRLFAEGRYEAAVPHLQRAIALAPHDASRAERLYLLSTAFLRIGDSPGTARVLAELMNMELPPPIRSKALANHCAYLRGIARLEEAEAAGRQAVEAADDDDSLGSATQTLASVLLTRGDCAQAGVMCDRALAAHRRSGWLLGELRTMGIRAALAQAEADTEQALSIYQSALERARAADLRLAIEELVINQSVLLTQLGRWKEVRELNAEAARLALADHRPRNAAVAYVNLALAEATTGNPTAALRRARTAIRLARRHLPILESAGWRALAQTHRCRGNVRLACRASTRAVVLSGRRGTAVERAWCRLEYGAALEAQRRLRPALHAWLEAADEVPRGHEPLKKLLLARAAVAACELQERDRARELESRIRQEPSAPSPLTAGALVELEVHLLLAEGEIPEALRKAEEALAALEAVGAPGERARTILSLMARLHEHGVHPQAGRSWLSWVCSECERVGNRRARERALALLVRTLEAGAGERPRLSEDELLEAVSELLTSLPNLKDLSKKAMELVVKQLQAERGVFFVAEPGSSQLHPMAEHGAVDRKVRRHAIGYSRRVVRQVAKSGGSLLIADALQDRRAQFESVAELKLRSILCVPLYASGHVVGAVYLDDSRRPEAFCAEDQRLLERIAHLLAVAIDRSHAHEEMIRANEQLLGENAELRLNVAQDPEFQELLGSSLAMQRILPVVARAAKTDVTVLITGENGTGKELIARLVHSAGARRLRPFVAVNCGAITDTLLESELFGILPNVATGVRGRAGSFRLADGGTLFLDEIGDMPLRQQVALLSVISNREVTPVGGGRPTKVDVRIITATNHDLAHMVESGEFRQDLFFRLNVLPIPVPPLRDRKTDIPILARHFASRMARAQKCEMPELASEFLARLMRYDWPGNVRQLQNTIERVMALHPGPKLTPRMLDDDPEFGTRRSAAKPIGSLSEQLQELERIRILEALERTGRNQAAAARELGLLEQTLRYRMEKYEIPSQRKKLRKPRRLRPIA